jgi:beta-lactam-binding protein with PASTA domain
MAFFKKLFSAYLWGNLLAMAAVAALVLFLLWKGLALYTNHGETVDVPSLVGMQESDALYTLERLGLRGLVADSAFNKRKPTGCILDQLPAAGAKVKAGREIRLTINSAQTPTLPLPDVADNSSLREAQAKLTAMGFKLGPVEYIPGDKDWVYGVKSRGRNVYSGERVPLDVPLILQVGNTSSIEAEEEMLDSLDDIDIGDIDDETIGIDDIFDL